MHHILIATDGSFDPSSGRGGWACVFALQTRIWALSGQEPKGHSPHRMELQAILQALEALTSPCQVVILTDDKRVLHDFEHGTSEPPEGKLWVKILKAALPHSVEFQWVKGHAGHPLNEQAHSLAQGVGLLPINAQGESKEKKKVSKSVQKVEAAAVVIAGPLECGETGQRATVAIRLNGSMWVAQVTTPTGNETLMGALSEGSTMHCCFFTALHETLQTVLARTEVTVLASTMGAITSAWQAKSPGKAHRQELKAVRDLVNQKSLILNFKAS
jgi:ribonuclease HI